MHTLITRIYLLAAVFTLAWACSSPDEERAGVVVAPASEEVVNDSAAEEPESPKEETQPARVIPSESAEYLFPIRRRDGSDTVLTAEYLATYNYREELYPFIKAVKEDDILVIRHPEFEYKLRAMPFDSSMAIITYHLRDEDQVTSIDYHDVIGTGGDLPKTQIARFTFLPKDGGDLVIVRPEFYEDLYNPSFFIRRELTSPHAFRTPDGGCILSISGGDGAYGYIAFLHMSPEGEVLHREIWMP